MPSFNLRINDLGQFIILVKVFPPSQNKLDYDQSLSEAKSYPALVDTGANTCSISEKVVTNLYLKPYGKQEIMTAGELHRTFVYMVGIAVPVTNAVFRSERQPNGSTITKAVPISEASTGLPRVKVTSFPDVGKERGFDLILGMNMLMPYHITIHNGDMIISI